MFDAMKKNVLHTYNVHMDNCLSLSSFTFLFQIEVSLTKDPTLGLGITGGSDGENTVKPGDTVSSLPLPPSLPPSPLPLVSLMITLPDHIS